MKKLAKKLLPKRETIKKQAGMSLLGKRLHDPVIWEVTRNKIAGGVAIGLFVNYFPVPFQMLWAALIALWLGVNLPAAVLCVWVNNPLTVIPLNFMIYKVGVWVTGDSQNLTLSDFEQHLTNFKHFWRELWTLFKLIWKPFLIGLPIVATLSAAIGFLLVQLIWRLSSFFYKP